MIQAGKFYPYCASLYLDDKFCLRRAAQTLQFIHICLHILKTRYRPRRQHLFRPYFLVLAATFIQGGLSWHGGVSWVVSKLRSPVPSPLRLLALQLKFESAGVSALHTLSIGLNPCDAVTGTQWIRRMIGRDVLTTPPFVGPPFCRSVGDLLTPLPYQQVIELWTFNSVCERSTTAPPRGLLKSFAD